MEIKSGRGYVYSIQYHIVWCVKYRHKIITPKIEKSLIEWKDDNVNYHEAKDFVASRKLKA